MSAIDTTAFYNHLVASGVELFTGVPDSLLQDLCACIYDRTPREANIVAANEGNAVGLACGYHVSTGKYASTGRHWLRIRVCHKRPIRPLPSAKGWINSNS